jgi:hypothetical protein
MYNNASYHDNKRKTKSVKSGNYVEVSANSMLNSAQFGRENTSKGKARTKRHEKAL